MKETQGILLFVQRETTTTLSSLRLRAIQHVRLFGVDAK